MSLAVFGLTVVVALFVYLLACALRILWVTKFRSTEFGWHSVQRRCYRYWWPRQLTIERPNEVDFRHVWRWWFWAFKEPVRRRMHYQGFSFGRWNSETTATGRRRSQPRPYQWSEVRRSVTSRPSWMESDSAHAPEGVVTGRIYGTHPYFEEVDKMHAKMDETFEQLDKTLEASQTLPEGEHVVHRGGKVINLSVKRGPK